MTNRRVMLGGAAAFLAQALISQAQTKGPKVAFQHDVPDLTMKNWAVTIVEVSYEPGESSASHKHPGITIAYVLDGEIASKVGDEPEKTYKTGEAFFETPNQLHAVSRNASASKPAKLLAVLLAEKGKQLTIPA